MLDEVHPYLDLKYCVERPGETLHCAEKETSPVLALVDCQLLL